MKFLSLARQSLRRFRRSGIYLNALYWTDSMTARLTRPSRSRGAYGTVLLASNGNGNIGDQAMVNAVLRHTPGEIVVILENEGALTIPSEFSPRVRTLVLPKLVRGIPISRIQQVITFAQTVSNAQTFAVVGADVMDGKYSPHESFARLSLLNVANILGVQTKVFGFSWAQVPHPHVQRCTVRLSRRVQLLVRDPQSAARLRKSGARVTDTADVVFTDSTIDALPQRFTDWIQLGDRFAILNCSGLIQQRMDQIPEYLELIRHLRHLGYRILFLPHVLRPGDNDLEATRQLWKLAGTENDLMVDFQVSPGQVRKLASHASFTITGRMHLAIMSLSQATPAVTLSTQGKVGGLYEMFKLPNLVVEPTLGFGQIIIAAIADITQPLSQDPIVDQATIDKTTRLAMRNFSNGTES